MSYIKVECRWQDENLAQLANLGIDSDDKYILKSVWVNKSKIAWLENYQGFILISFSGITDDSLITNLKHTKENIKLFTHE
jgi:hypothetical protein